MNIAICDDEKSQVQLIANYTKAFTSEIEDLVLFTYDSGENLLQAINEHTPFDLIFLDIQMKGLNGIDTAKQIRKTDSNVLIVFITNFKGFVFNGYEVNAFRYLTKPIRKEKFDEAMKSALSAKVLKIQKYIVQTKREAIVLYIRDIVYLECFKHQIVLHTSEKTYAFNSNFTCEEKKLSLYNFIRVHKSFIINMDYIEIIREKDIMLKNGVVIPLSRSRKQQIWVCFKQYIMNSN